MSPFRDLLAEIEVTMTPAPRLIPDPRLTVLSSGAPPPGRRNRFWCALMEQQVEVEFETLRTLGFSRRVGVRSCTAFESPEAVACRRRCLDAQFRRQWPPALPVADRARRASPKA